MRRIARVTITAVLLVALLPVCALLVVDYCLATRGEGNE